MQGSKKDGEELESWILGASIIVRLFDSSKATSHDLCCHRDSASTAVSFLCERSCVAEFRCNNGAKAGQRNNTSGPCSADGLGSCLFWLSCLSLLIQEQIRFSDPSHSCSFRLSLAVWKGNNGSLQARHNWMRLWHAATSHGRLAGVRHGMNNTGWLVQQRQGKAGACWRERNNDYFARFASAGESVKTELHVRPCCRESHANCSTHHAWQSILVLRRLCHCSALFADAVEWMTGVLIVAVARGMLLRGRQYASRWRRVLDCLIHAFARLLILFLARLTET